MPGSDGPIDREAPTRRPVGRAVIRQSWSQLLFLHWDLPADQIRPMLPRGLELDLFEGRALVGLVPFTMTGVRPAGLPAVPWLSRFPETNVRTYVHVEGRDPGVWFFSLDAANPIAVQVARSSFHLPYHFARMSLTRLPPVPEMPMGGVSYRSDRRWPGPRPASSAIEAGPRGPVIPAQVGTLEHFLVERYILYAAHRSRLYQGRVHHAPYPLQAAEVHSLDENLIAAAGLTRPDSPPPRPLCRGGPRRSLPAATCEITSH